MLSSEIASVTVQSIHDNLTQLQRLWISASCSEDAYAPFKIGQLFYMSSLREVNVSGEMEDSQSFESDPNWSQSRQSQRRRQMERHALECSDC